MNTRHLSRILVFCLIGMLIAGAAFAQGRPGPGPRPGQGQVEMLRVLGRLNLSDAQKAQIRSILDKARADAQAIRNSSASDEEKQAQLRQLREQTIELVRAVLTEEQRAKFDRFIERREDLIDCLSKLGLTDDQKQKIQAIRKSAADQIKAVMADASLTNPQKREKVMQIRRDSMKQAMEVLTPEQREQLKECLKERRGNE